MTHYESYNINHVVETYIVCMSHIENIKKSEFKDRVKMLEGCISGSIHFVMMVKEDEGPDRRIHGITRTTILVMNRVNSVR